MLENVIGALLTHSVTPLVLPVGEEIVVTAQAQNPSERGLEKVVKVALRSNEQVS